MAYDWSAITINLKRKEGIIMALINCPECGKEVSDQAVSCPNCGTPINKVEKKFCLHCGEKIDKDCVICPKCGKQVAQIGSSEKSIIINNNNNNIATSSASAVANNVGYSNAISPKSRLITLLLCIFLGILGVHRFYVGKIGTGILMILLMFVYIGEIWLLVDFILIIIGSFTDKNGLKIKKW